jgi:hypothetical protein
MKHSSGREGSAPGLRPAKRVHFDEQALSPNPDLPSPQSGQLQQPNKSRLAAVFGKDVRMSPELSHIRYLSPEILRDPTGSPCC